LCKKWSIGLSANNLETMAGSYWYTKKMGSVVGWKKGKQRGGVPL